VEVKREDMKKTLRNIVKRITDYLKEIIADEMRVMDAFYRQFA